MCPPGEVIRAVTFASYGTPLGQCGAFLGDPACDAEGARLKVEQSCLQQDICTIDVGNGFFGDPCGGVSKKLLVEAICGKATCGDGILDSYEFCDEGGDPHVACSKCAPTCEGGFLSENLQSCYLLTGAAKPWADARQECLALGPGCDLVAFNSISEHAAVAKQMTQSVWIGGRRNPSAWGEMPAYAWTTREPWAFGPSDQWTENKTGTGPSLPWDTDNNEPNGASGDPCVELKLDPQLQVFSEMNDAGCSVPKPGLCECKLPGVPCDHDGIRDLGESSRVGSSRTPPRRAATPSFSPTSPGPRSPLPVAPWARASTLRASTRSRNSSCYRPSISISRAPASPSGWMARISSRRGPGGLLLPRRRFHSR
jgi:hypothetical protein